MADASYPDDLKYHAEHDWARIDGDTATFGITWYAQDQLGEVVFFDPPDGRQDGDQGRAVRRGRVREGGLRRRRAAVGRDHRGQRGARRRAREDQRGPVRRRLDGEGASSRTPSEVEDLLDADAYEGSLCLSPLHLRHRRRPARRCSSASAPARSTSCSPTSRRACGSAARSTCRRASRSRRCTRYLRDLAARNVSHRGRDHRSSAPGCTTTTSRRWSTRCSRARSS